MRKATLTILTILFCLSWAEVRVEKVAEIKSIKDYNQWVTHNKTRYPALEHIKVSSEIIKWGEEYKLYYYNANGDVFKEEILKAKPGIWLSVEVDLYEGRVVTYETPSAEGGEGVPAVVTARDSQGNITCRFISSGAGLFSIPSIGFFTNNINKKKVEVINWAGNKIAEFASSAEDYFEFGRMEYVNTPDHRYVLLSFMMGSPHVALWEENDGTYHELWQEKLSSSVHLSISNDGQYSCIGNSGCVYVYDRAGKLLYSFRFSKGGTDPRSKFSPDSNFLVCALSSQMALIDIKTGKPLWEIPVPGDAFARQVFFAKSGEYIVLTHISVEKAYIYDLHGTLQTTIDNVFGCSVIDDLIICGDAKDEYHKIIYRISEE